MESKSLYDVIVVGAGIEGSATAYHLAKKGQCTLLIEQVIISLSLSLSLTLSLSLSLLNVRYWKILEDNLF